MFDLYINPTTGDLDYQNGSLSLVRDTNRRVRQELEVTLRAFKGEWFNNTQFGGINRDYIGRVGITKQEVDAWYRRIILSNPEVLELVHFDSSFNRISRQYDLEFVVRTKKGDESVRVALRPDQEVNYVLPPAQDYLPPTTPSIKTMSAFITGTSDVASIMSKNAISFVSAPIIGTGSITATIERLFQAVTITGTGTITAGNGTKVISATITGSGDIAAYISTVMSATLSATPDTVSASITKVLSSTMAGSTGISASMSKQFSATISGSGDVAAEVDFGGMALLTGTSSVTASVAKAMVASISGTDTVVATAAHAVSATISGTSSVTSIINKRLVATVSGTSATSAQPSKRLVSTIAGTSTTTANMVKRLSATITSTHNVTASIGRGIIAGDIAGTSTVSANITKVKYGSASIAGGGDSTSATAYKVKSMAATLSGGVDSVVAEAFPGLSGSAYDVSVMSASNSTAYYLPFREDYQANGGSASTRPVLDMARFRGLDKSHGYTNGLGGNYNAAYPATQQKGIVRDSVARSMTAKLSTVTKNIIHLPNTPDSSGKLTVIMWIKTPATLTNTILLATSPALPPFAWEIGYDSTGRMYSTFRTNTTNSVDNTNYITCITTAQQIYTKAETFVAVVFDNNDASERIKLYATNRGGSTAYKLPATTTTTGVFSLGNDTTPDYMEIGGITGAAFTGNIERLSLHRDALSESTLTGLFRLGNRTDHDIAVINKGASSYIRFERFNDKTYADNHSVYSGFDLNGNGTTTSYGTYQLTSGSLGGMSKTLNSSANYQKYLATSDVAKTFNVWVRPTAYPASSSTIMEMHHPITTEGFGAIALGMTPSGGLWAYVGDEDSVVDFIEVFNTNAHLNLNTTYMITLVYDRTSVTPFMLYVNGGWVTSDGYNNNGWNSSFALPTGSLELFYGSWSKTSDTGGGFAGCIERASTFERVLTQEEITNLYNTGTVAGYIPSG